MSVIVYNIIVVVRVPTHRRWEIWRKRRLSVHRQCGGEELRCLSPYMHNNNIL